MAEPQPDVPESPSPEPREIVLRPATINDRFIAYVIDFAPFGTGFLLSLWLGTTHEAYRYLVASPGRFVLTWAGLYVLYHFLGNLTGATVGKRLMGLRIVTARGAKPGVARSLARAVGLLVSTPLCNAGFLVALLHQRSRALHDLMAGTYVIDAKPANPFESWLLFFASVILLVGIYFGMLYGTINQPTAQDRFEVLRARAALRVLAQVEESYKARHGTYTDSLGDLAAASGDFEGFRRAMLEIFVPDRFGMKAGKDGYVISAAARDRKKTQVSVQGPPPKLSP